MPIENAPYSSSTAPPTTDSPLQDAPDHTIPYLSVRYAQQDRPTSIYHLSLAFSPSEPLRPNDSLRVVAFPVVDVQLPRAKKAEKRDEKPTTTAFKFVYSHTKFEVVLGESERIPRDSWVQMEKEGEKINFLSTLSMPDSSPSSHLAAPNRTDLDSHRPLLYTCFLKCTRSLKEEFVRFGLVSGPFGESPLGPNARLVALSNILNLVNNHSKMRQVTHGAMACLLLAQTTDDDATRQETVERVLSELEKDGCTVHKSYWNKHTEAKSSPKEKFEQAIKFKDLAIAHSLYLDFPQIEVETAEACTRNCAKMFKTQSSHKEPRIGEEKIGVVDDLSASCDPSASSSTFMYISHSLASDSSFTSDVDELGSSDDAPLNGDNVYQLGVDLGLAQPMSPLL